MSFNFQGFDKGSSAPNTDAQQLFTYTSSTDSMSTISGANYFLPALDYFKVGSQIFVIAADNFGTLQVITLTDTSITTEQIDSNVNISYVDNLTLKNVSSISNTAGAFTATAGEWLIVNTLATNQTITLPGVTANAGGYIGIYRAGTNSATLTITSSDSSLIDNNLTTLSLFRDCEFVILKAVQGLGWAIHSYYPGRATNGQLMIGSTAGQWKAGTVTSSDGTILVTTGSNTLDLITTGTSYPVDAIATANSPYTASWSSYVNVTMDGNVTINLPTAIGFEGRDLYITRFGASNILTVNAFGGQTINGSASITITGDKTVLNVYSDGANVKVGGGYWIEATSSSAGIIKLTSNINTYADNINAVTPSDVASKLGPQTATGMPYGAGPGSSIGWTNALTNGQVVIGNGAGNPQAANITSTGSTITITNGANSINMEAVPTIPFSYAISDETTALTTGTKLTVRAPYAATIVGVRASLTTASASGTVTLDVLKNGSTIFSTKLTMASGATTTVGQTAYVLSSTTFADDDIIAFAIDGAGTTAAGCKVTLYLKKI